MHREDDPQYLRSEIRVANAVTWIGRLGYAGMVGVGLYFGDKFINHGFNEVGTASAIVGGAVSVVAVVTSKAAENVVEFRQDKLDSLDNRGEL